MEVLYDETDRVWLMLHSGSRHIGMSTAEYYNKLAMEQMIKLGIKDAKKDGLNYMRMDSE